MKAIKKLVQREKVDLVLVPVSGRRVCARVPEPEPLVSLCLFSCLSFVSPRLTLPELWFNPHPETLTRSVNRHQRWLDCWSKGAVVWRGKRGEVVFSSPGGGGYESSVVASSYLREVVGFFSIASSVLSPGGEGFHSLASPALVELSGGLVFGSDLEEIDEAPQRGQKVEEKWFRWRLSGFELRRNEGFGGCATAAFRLGDGQVEAKAAR
ncbi:LOW QUALITY PROTEIN: hypothetical protein YC2023_051743 [Brassica napus]